MSNLKLIAVNGFSNGDIGYLYYSY